MGGAGLDGRQNTARNVFEFGKLTSITGHPRLNGATVRNVHFDSLREPNWAVRVFPRMRHDQHTAVRELWGSQGDVQGLCSYHRILCSRPMRLVPPPSLASHPPQRPPPAPQPSPPPPFPPRP